MEVEIVQLEEKYLEEATLIWNSVVEDGKAFPQTDTLSIEEARVFFSDQTYTAVAIDENTQEVEGMYILHPNNIGRCGHICNASYAVKKEKRGLHIGELLVEDCLKTAKKCGFRILQFNAVVRSNKSALKLYKKMGLTQLGIIPQGFLNKNGEYEDIIPHYIEL